METLGYSPGLTPVIVCSVGPGFAHWGSAPHVFFSVGTAEVWDHPESQPASLCAGLKPGFALGIKQLLCLSGQTCGFFGSISPWKLIWFPTYFLSVCSIGKWAPGKICIDQTQTPSNYQCLCAEPFLLSQSWQTWGHLKWQALVGGDIWYLIVGFGLPPIVWLI